MNEETNLLGKRYCSKSYLIILGVKKKTIKKILGEPELTIKSRIGDLNKDKYYDVEKVKSILWSILHDEYVEYIEEILFDLIEDQTYLDKQDDLIDSLLDLVEIDETISESKFKDLIEELFSYQVPVPIVLEMENSLVNYLYIRFDTLARLFRYNKENNIKFSKNDFQKLVFTYLILNYTNIEDLFSVVFKSNGFIWENMILEAIFVHFKAENKYLNRFFQGLDLNPITHEIFYFE